MEKIILVYWIHLMILAYQSQLGTPNACSDTGDLAKAAVILELHSGPECANVNLKGIQQLAAMNKALADINQDLSYDKIQMDLQVFDTCGTNRGAVAGAMKALVKTGQTCMNPPFFLGFIGPDDPDMVDQVLKITKVFGLAHVVPYSADQKNGISVTTYPLQQHSQALLLLIQKLGWTSLSVLSSNTSLAKTKANYFIKQIIKSTIYCVEQFYIGLEKLAEIQSDGVIVVVDDPQEISSILKSPTSNNVQIIASVMDVGLQSWDVHQQNNKLFILQQVNASPIRGLSNNFNETLIKEYSNQQTEVLYRLCEVRLDKETCKELLKNPFEDNQDWSISLYHSSLLLLSSGLRVAHYLKCRHHLPKDGVCPELSSMSPKDWTGILKEATVFRKPEGSKGEKLQFGMTVSTAFNVYGLNPSFKFRKVGCIVDGTLISEQGYDFPRAVTSSGSFQCRRGQVGNLLNPPRVKDESAQIQKIPPESWDLNLNDLEMIGALVGFAFGALSTILLAIVCVYRVFRVKTDESSSRSTRSRRGSSSS